MTSRRVPSCATREESETVVVERDTLDLTRLSLILRYSAGVHATLAPINNPKATASSQLQAAEDKGASASANGLLAPEDTLMNRLVVRGTQEAVEAALAVFNAALQAEAAQASSGKR